MEELGIYSLLNDEMGKLRNYPIFEGGIIWH